LQTKTFILFDSVLQFQKLEFLGKEIMVLFNR